VEAVVGAEPGKPRVAERLVRRLGGNVGHRLPMGPGDASAATAIDPRPLELPTPASVAQSFAPATLDLRALWADLTEEARGTAPPRGDRGERLDGTPLVRAAVVGPELVRPQVVGSGLEWRE
jgi:hypothetical protein